MILQWLGHNSQSTHYERIVLCSESCQLTVVGGSIFGCRDACIPVKQLLPTPPIQRALVSWIGSTYRDELLVTYLLLRQQHEARD